MLDLIGKLVDPVSNILDKVVEDKDQKARLAHEIATMAEKKLSGSYDATTEDFAS